MVSSRDRLLEAAAREFAARGYDGAGVDAIARAARLNKAMIYYHFKSKSGLYRAVVEDVFGAVLQSVGPVADTRLAPDEKLRRFIRILADVISSRPQFPTLWLAEFLSGVPHLDRATLAIVRQVVAVLGRILDEGVRQGKFRPMSPLEVHISVVAPLLLFVASERTRRRLAKAGVPGVATLTLDRIVSHVTGSTLAVLCRKEGKRNV